MEKLRGIVEVKFMPTKRFVKGRYVIKDLVGQFRPMYDAYRDLIKYGERFGLYKMSSNELDGFFGIARFGSLLDSNCEGLITIEVETEISKEFLMNQLATIGLVFNELPHTKTVNARFIS